MYSRELGIVETREIIKAVDDAYQYDFKDYALTAFKQRLERIMEIHNVSSSEILIKRIVENKDFFEVFLMEVCIGSTEMFRDPSLWRVLRDDFFPSMLENTEQFRIWLPVNVSGEELYTLAIVLKELGYLDKVEIFATFFSDYVVKDIQRGVMSIKRQDVSLENYKRFHGKGNFSDYYSIQNNEIMRDTSLIKNVKFLKQNIIFDNSPTDVNLILFRNHMIYYNQTMADKVLKIMCDSLIPGGHFIIGDKEYIADNKTITDFVLVSNTESIYKKKFM